jgi:hypothetical protein
MPGSSFALESMVFDDQNCKNLQQGKNPILLIKKIAIP